MESEEVDNATSQPPKRIRRNEVLAKKKSMEEILKAASSQKDPLAPVLPCAHCHTKGLSVCLESGGGDKLSSHLKQYIQKLLKVNMEAPFGSEWPVEEKVKRKDMVSPEARYIFVYEYRNAESNQIPLCEKANSSSCKGAIVGFVHYRFVVEEDVPVLYVYELQLEATVQGKGLGKFLMELIERIAYQNRMGAVVLTVQKTNTSAMNFYMNKLGYTVSASSPSKFSQMVMKYFLKHSTMKQNLYLRTTAYGRLEFTAVVPTESSRSHASMLIPNTGELLGEYAKADEEAYHAAQIADSNILGFSPSFVGMINCKNREI